MTKKIPEPTFLTDGSYKLDTETERYAAALAQLKFIALAPIAYGSHGPEACRDQMQRCAVELLRAIEGATTTSPLDERLLTLLREDPDGYIKAIKLHRQHDRRGLVESRDYVMKLMAAHGIKRKTMGAERVESEEKARSRLARLLSGSEE